MNKQELDQAFALAKDLAKQAGEVFNKYFRATDIGFEWKEDNSPVTIADTTINQMVIDSIKEHYPSHGVIGEEDSYHENQEWVWVLDPLDGTSTFSLGIPVSTFCLALVHDGEVLLSVVYDPFQDRLFAAQKGQGAYMNDAKLVVSEATDIKRQYVLAFRSLTKPNHTGVNSMVDVMLKEGAKVYMFAGFSYAGTLVADGHFVMACMTHGSPWDAAAISLIVQEAGGMVTDLNGKPRKFNEWGDGLLVTNGKVHQKILDLIDYENTKD